MERFAVIGKVGTWFAVARMIDHGHGPIEKHDIQYFAHFDEADAKRCKKEWEAMK